MAESDIKLTGQDKKELLTFLDAYARKIPIEVINEMEDKLDKKVRRLRKRKRLPSFVRKMISQIKDLTLLLDYSAISQRKLNRVISALHYFVWAEDRIPDYIPVIGYLDDAFVISIVYQEVKEDVRQFKKIDKK